MGPRALSFGEAVALIAQATGRSVEHVDIDPEEFIEHQVAQGVPPFAARMLTGIYGGIRDGRADALADGVQRRREPRDRPPDAPLRGLRRGRRPRRVLESRRK